MTRLDLSITIYDEHVEQLRRVTENFNANRHESIVCSPEDFARIVLTLALEERCARLDERAKIDQVYADIKAAQAGTQQERAA